jgi:hypothetical protein
MFCELLGDVILHNVPLLRADPMNCDDRDFAICLITHICLLAQPTISSRNGRLVLGTGDEGKFKRAR